MPCMPPAARSSSAPSKKSNGSQPGDAWRAFVAEESVRLKAENPKSKHAMVVKKCSVKWKEIKAQKEHEEHEHEHEHEQEGGDNPSSEMGEDSQTA